MIKQLTKDSYIKFDDNMKNGKCYTNTIEGREALTDECSKKEINEVLSVWGASVIEVHDTGNEEFSVSEIEQLRADVDFLLMLGGEQ